MFATLFCPVACTSIGVPPYVIFSTLGVCCVYIGVFFGITVFVVFIVGFGIDLIVLIGADGLGFGAGE